MDVVLPDRRCFFCEVEHKPRCEVCFEKWCAGPACKDKRLRTPGNPLPLTHWTVSWPPAAKAVGANPSIAGRVHGRLTLSASIVRVDKLRVHDAAWDVFDLVEDDFSEFFVEVLTKIGEAGFDGADPLRAFVERGIIK